MNYFTPSGTLFEGTTRKNLDGSVVGILKIPCECKIRRYTGLRAEWKCRLCKGESYLERLIPLFTSQESALTAPAFLPSDDPSRVVKFNAPYFDRKARVVVEGVLQSRIKKGDYPHVGYECGIVTRSGKTCLVFTKTPVAKLGTSVIIEGIPTKVSDKNYRFDKCKILYLRISFQERESKGLK